MAALPKKCVTCAAGEHYPYGQNNGYDGGGESRGGPYSGGSNGPYGAAGAPQQSGGSAPPPSNPPTSAPAPPSPINGSTVSDARWLLAILVVPSNRPNNQTLVGVSYQVINNNYVNVTNGTANVSKCVCNHVTHCMRLFQVHFPEVLGSQCYLARSSNAVSSQSTPPQQDNASQGSQQQQQGVQQQGPQQQGGGGYFPG